MANWHQTLKFSSSPDEAWAKIADVGAVNQIFPFLGEVTLEGDSRTCDLGDGTLEELIVTVDADRRRLVYAIVGGPLPFTQHSATMQVVPTEGGGCLLEWDHDFKPDSVEPMLIAAVTPAVDALYQTIG